MLKSVGRYDVLDVIGRGGAAVVYRAYQSDLDREVALKELAPAEVGDPTFSARFLRESRLIGSLNHPNIVTVFEYFEHEGVPYIAMEYVPRGSLRGYEDQLTLVQIAGLLEGVLAGLAYGQSRDIVHRDLKPENLLITSDGRVKIADFGIARAYTQAVTSAGVTVTGTTVGTPVYMAPEQALGQTLGPATDLYSLGMITWELLAGRSPFEPTDTPVAILYRHVHEPISPITAFKPEIDPELAAWLERMLAKLPEDRFPDAEVAWDAFEEIIVRLEGPLWRRGARLRQAGKIAEARPLTPAPFTQATPPGGAEVQPTPSAGEVAASAEAEPEPTPPSREVPEPANVTQAPRVQRAPAMSTVYRVLRRHDAEEPLAAPAEAGPRRAVLVGALIVGVIAAVALGVLAGQGGGATRTETTTPAARAPAKPAFPVQGAAALNRIVQNVASVRSQGLASLAKAKTPGQQAAAATVIADAYTTGAGRIDGLASSISSLALAQSLRRALLQTASAYTELAKAASHDNRTAYAAAESQAKADEQLVQRELNQIDAAATRGR